MQCRYYVVNEQRTAYIQGQQLKQVEHFKYLVSAVTNDVTTSADITRTECRCAQRERCTPDGDEDAEMVRRRHPVRQG